MQKRVKKFPHKKFKNVKEKELPSFLLDLKITNENKALLPKDNSEVHLGPIFFGCKQYHPPLYSLNLAGFHQPQYTASFKENVLEGVFISKPVVERHEEVRKAFHPVVKRRKVFTDPYPHKCPGNKKVFKPEVTPHVIDLGETTSIIEGEISQEIPLCWLKRITPGKLDTEFELVTLSDIRERERPFLPYKERIAHTHFPKEFVTVQVIGPTIPAALTINKIRSKREFEVEVDVHVQSEPKETKKKIPKKETEKEAGEVIIEEAELDFPAEIFSDEEEKKEESNRMESIESNIFEEKELSEQCLSEMEETVSEVEGENVEKEMSMIFSEEEELNEAQSENEESELEN